MIDIGKSPLDAGEGKNKRDHFSGDDQSVRRRAGVQGHSARLSDRGDHGGPREGGIGQELGSHGGRHRGHQNPGPQHRGKE